VRLRGRGNKTKTHRAEAHAEERRDNTHNIRDDDLCIATLLKASVHNKQLCVSERQLNLLGFFVHKEWNKRPRGINGLIYSLGRGCVELTLGAMEKEWPSNHNYLVKTNSEGVIIDCQ